MAEGTYPVGLRGASKSGAAPRHGATLEAFLAEPSPATAMDMWFGDELSRACAGNRERRKALLAQDIATIDELLSAQVSEIIHAERFRSLEASWRGVRYLAGLIDKGDRVKLRILNVTWAEVERDFDGASDFDQSALFDLIYSQEFGTAGGEPFGLIVGDYYVRHGTTEDHRTDDIAILKAMAATSAAAFSPFVCGCDPRTLDLYDFQELGTNVDLENIFNRGGYDRWHRLRDIEDARFIGICLPNVLLRDAWGDSAGKRASFCFREVVSDPARGGSLWGNGAFAFAAIVIRAFVQTGWFAEIRGVQRGESGGGLVPKLPISVFRSDTPNIAFKHPIQVAISDRQERRLSDLGFIPLCVAEYLPAVIFYSNQSLQRPARYSNSEATVNARLSSMMQYVLCIARFAHTLKIIGRERVASFATAAECQTMMRSWLSTYVMANASASLDLRTRYPLREGRVSVAEQPGRPGCFKMDIYLRPQLQLDDISTGIRLTTELTTPRAA